MQPLRILVVDDEPDVQSLFVQMFRKQLRAGLFEMTFADSGKDALKIVEEQGADNLTLVLSDINMPGMDGLELLKILKEKFKELKVIMITAYGDESNFKQANALGADEFLTKPVNFSLLQEKLEKLSR